MLLGFDDVFLKHSFSTFSVIVAFGRLVRSIVLFIALAGAHVSGLMRVGGGLLCFANTEANFSVSIQEPLHTRTEHRQQLRQVASVLLQIPLSEVGLGKCAGEIRSGNQFK